MRADRNAREDGPRAESGLTRREALQGMFGMAALPLLPSVALAEGDKALDLPSSPRDLGPVDEASRDRPFNTDWHFYRGDAPGAEQPGFDDSGWRSLDVPHDWSIEDLPETADQGRGAIWTEGTNPSRVGPFDLYASEGQAATGWVVGGVGWYRKTFNAPNVPPSGKAEIRFEGVYMNSDVWLNGTFLGNHPYGYTGFAYDLTPRLTPGANVIAVRVKNTGQNSRWYSGSGIFRKVSIRVAGALRIIEHGIRITTPEVSREAAQVKLEVSIESGAADPRLANIRVRLLNSTGGVVDEHQAAATIPPTNPTVNSAALSVEKPMLWSPADPQLYHAEVVVEMDGKAVDIARIPFGIRKVQVDATQGLRINGESIKLRGGCVHHDNGSLGSACIPRAEERRVELLKANGFNAIRTSHNPPSGDFLDACDRLGMLVIDEVFDCWTIGKNAEDYHLYFKEWWKRDLERMVMRDRNHPSVIFWSIGNEIPERAEPTGVEIGKQLAGFIKTLDPTRPVTAAICGPWDHLKQTWADMQPAFTYLDVGGYNYQWKSYAPDHESFPERIMMGTESFPDEAFQNWSAIEASSYIIGDFVWTAMDYLGESGIGNASLAHESGASPSSRFYPWFNSYCGDIDLIGNKKPQSCYRDVLWGRTKIDIAVQRPIPARFTEQISKWGWSDELRSWTWPEHPGTPIRVRVYARGDEVKLFLNGKQVGHAQLSPNDALTAQFDVPYSPGELKAVAFHNGEEIATTRLATVGRMNRIFLAPDRAQIRASRDDLAYVMAHVVDDDNRSIPDAVVPITFSVSGSGELLAVASANPKDVASFRQPMRSTFHGVCLAVLRPTGAPGTIVLKAEAPGLAPARVEVETS